MLRKVAYYRSKMCILGNMSTGTFQGVSAGRRGEGGVVGFLLYKTVFNFWFLSTKPVEVYILYTGFAEKHVDVCDG